MITKNREAIGFLLSVAFVCLAAGRDVYFGALFQRVHPLAVALTAFAMKEDRERFLAAGFDGYLEKPLDVRELPGRVAAALEAPNTTGAP